MSGPLRVRPSTLKAARRFVGEHHRHSAPPIGGLFAVAVEDEAGATVAVGIAARPVARLLDDGATIEVTRCCTTAGAPNAASMIYGALCRAARALGYSTAVTYTLAAELGVSLRASGWDRVADVRLDTWNRPGRSRYEHDLFGNAVTPAGAKVRWERAL